MQDLLVTLKQIVRAVFTYYIGAKHVCGIKLSVHLLCLIFVSLVRFNAFKSTPIKIILVQKMGCAEMLYWHNSQVMTVPVKFIAL